jgi:glycosyltransferase involved in cell wall biosynthesis
VSHDRVTVVVACYDDGATLGETLRSLAGQEPHELIVVDDGSTDAATLQLMDDLRAAGIRVLRQENAGLSAARMTGVAAGSSPYVLPLDADDALTPGAIASLADALDANPEAALAWGDVEVFGDVSLRVAGAPALDPWHITYVNELPVASLVRRDSLTAAGGWQIDGYEDWDLWMGFAERGFKGIHVPRTTLLHRRHGHRMNAGCLDNHGEKMVELRSRHAELFALRHANWRHSALPWRTRALTPLVSALPLVPAYDKHRLYRLISRPHEVLPGRRARLRSS